MKTMTKSALRYFVPPFAASLALLSGCETPKSFTEQADIAGLNASARAFIVATAERCQAKPLDVILTFGRRPIFTQLAQDAESGAFSAVYERKTSDGKTERLLVSQEELLHPNRLSALQRDMKKTGKDCVAAHVDVLSLRRAVAAINAAQSEESERSTAPERPGGLAQPLRMRGATTPL